MPTDTTGQRPGIAYLVMTVTPLFFSSNLVFGRGIGGEVAPFMLAFLRWSFVALALTPFMLREREELLRVWRRRPATFLRASRCGLPG